MIVEQEAKPDTPPIEVFDGGPSPTYPLELVIVVQVINDGETTEFVREVLLEQASGENGYHLEDPRPDIEIAPHSRFTSRVFAKHTGVDWSGGFFASARLATQIKPIRSTVHRLDEWLLETLD